MCMQPLRLKGPEKQNDGTTTEFQAIGKVQHSCLILEMLPNVLDLFKECRWSKEGLLPTQLLRDDNNLEENRMM